MINRIKDNILYVAWITAVISMVGSLYFGEIMGLAPCSLCWYLRIVMYPLVLIIGLGIIKKDRHFYDYALPLSFIGVAMALYQNLLYYSVMSEGTSPCTFGTSCITKYVSLLGFIDIPLLALFASIIITATLLIHKKHVQRN